MYRVGEELTQSAVELLCLESMHLHHSLRRHVFPISPLSPLLWPFHIHQPCNDKLAPVHEVLREEAMVKLLAHEVVVVKRARNDGNQDIHPLQQLGHFLQGSVVLKEAVKCYLIELCNNYWFRSSATKIELTPIVGRVWLHFGASVLSPCTYKVQEALCCSYWPQFSYFTLTEAQ